ncbi:MAG: TVP38/TMEM64 family protein [Alphaproteobacteria bacterium]|nr:MAG: TVP38/TMEM64 family protein [Alphaproteobacteria bacterium]
MDQRRKTLLKRLPLVVIALTSVAGFVVLRPWLDFATLAAYRGELMEFVAAHRIGAVLAFIAGYCAIVGFSLPGATLATLTGGFLFGVFPGVLFNLAGATGGALVIFLAVRMGIGESLAARIDASDGAVRRLKRGIDENQWSVLFLMRLLPVVPFFVANVVPAMLAVPTWRFFVTTALGIIPGALIYTAVGAGLGTVFETGGTPDLSIIFQPRILLPILGLAALALLPILFNLWRKGSSE